MNRKTLSLIAMIISGVIAFSGLLVMAGALGGDTSFASGSYWYDSGYATFGGDFYTYVNNNAAEAAEAVSTVASNLNAIASLMKNVFGIFLMGFGLLSLCHFCMIWLEEKAKAAPVQEAEAAPAAEIPEEAPVEAAAEEEIPEIPAE